MDAATRDQLCRQVAHWTLAAERLADLGAIASPTAWAHLEHYLGLAVRNSLSQSVARLCGEGRQLRARLDGARNEAQLAELRVSVAAFRERYLQTEVLLDFYGDAVNTRTNPETAALLRACDHLAKTSLEIALRPLGRPVPPVLSFVDKGLGAAILKAGLRLWDGETMNPAAAIRVARHNLMRPTSLIHEAGHQFAHIVGWNDELAEIFRRELKAPGEVAATWAGWASEVAADAFAFVHVGYAAVATLHDILTGPPASVFSYGFTPHPASYIRVLLGIEMCRRSFGAGPWDEMRTSWVDAFPLAAPAAGEAVREMMGRSVERLADLVELIIHRPMKSFRDRPLTAVVDPQRVAPAALDRLAADAGGALFVSSHWLSQEALRLTALTGLRAAMRPAEAQRHFNQQREWMLRLGGHDLVQAA